MKAKKLKIYLISIIVATLYLLSCIFFYQSNIQKFKKYISCYDYTNAKTLLSDKTINLITLFNFENQCSKIINDHLNELNDEYLLSNISQENLLMKLTTLEDLQLNTEEIATFKENLPLISSSNESYLQAISLFNNENYSEALELFNNISYFNSNYDEILQYKDKCINILKDNVITQANKLLANNEYSNAINYLNEHTKELNYNLEIINKVEEIKKLRMDYLEEFSEDSIINNKYSAQTMSSYYNKLNSSTINTFDIASNTNKLVFVNISEQKTYIYTGHMNNWSLEKEFLCSTGIENKETPVGIFEVQTRAPWFFASTYKQGGKYYVQFMGNYLFHSIPFAEDQETVLDETLGEPASHGCIRLSTDDAKWLYDNVVDGSKIIIY